MEQYVSWNFEESNSFMQPFAEEHNPGIKFLW